MSRFSPFHLAAMAGLLFGLSNAAPMDGQVITGTVVEAGDNRPLAGVEVRLLEFGETVEVALSDSAGSFRLRAPYPGQFTLLATGLGYDSLQVTAFEVFPGEAVRIAVRMGARPIELAPLEVIARASRGQGLMKDYYYRLDQNRKTGLGRVLDREELEKETGLTTSDVLGRQPFITQGRNRNNVKQIYLRQRGRSCLPRYFLNGLPADEGVLQIPVSVLEGIEIYRHGENHDYRFGCGMVAAWTRQDFDPTEAQGDALSRSLWATLGISAGIMLVALFGLR